MGAALSLPGKKVENSTYLHQERHRERCNTTVHVGVEFLGYGVNPLRAPWHRARLGRITAQVFQVKDLSNHYRRDLIGMSKLKPLTTKQDIPVQTTSETEGLKNTLSKITANIRIYRLTLYDPGQECAQCVLGPAHSSQFRHSRRLRPAMAVVTSRTDFWKDDPRHE